MATTDENNGVYKGVVNYTSRDYQSILQDFKNAVPTLTDLWKPEAEADPGMVLLKVLASLGETLGVNTDWLANEIFAPSVSQRKNAEKIFGLIGYELGFYTAARTEVTFTNNSSISLSLDFGFNGNNFSTLNAYNDITGASRTITYNILPLTNKYGATETRSRREVVSTNLNVFADSDPVTLAPGESVTRVAIEGELRSYSVSVHDVKNNNYIIKLPSQHLDTTAVWIKARATSTSETFLETQWIQCANPAEFIVPEPRFSVTYDNYSNAQIQISNYLNQLENYDSNYLVVYWIDCSGVIGCVSEDVLSNYLQAKPSTIPEDNSGDITISNLSNTIELPNTHTVTGKSPETAKQAYQNSRNYINTFDSLVTLPDYQRFLNREAGIDTGICIDCQKALDLNMAIYNDDSMTDDEKKKHYLNKYDYPAGTTKFNWTNILGFDPENKDNFIFSANFKTYTCMCYAIHNDFKDSSWGTGQTSTAQYRDKDVFIQYKPPQQLINAVIRDYRPLQALSVELEFGWVRVFNWYAVGTITPLKPVSKDVAKNIVAAAKEALALYFAPANREIGVMPTLMEVIDVIERSHTQIRHFDPGSPGTVNYGIMWDKCDPSWWNPCSFAKLQDPGESADNIRIHPAYITK